MIPLDNSNEMLGIYADWLEDQDIDTAELREGIDSVGINQWHHENSLGHTMDWITLAMITVGTTFDDRVGGLTSKVGCVLVLPFVELAEISPNANF